jgi:hypothetical protein
MKTIGLLGGMSWESSIEYEQLINKEVRRRLGGSHSDLLIRSYDFAEIEAFQEAGDWAAAGSRLEATPGGLQGAGVELASIRRARSTLPSVSRRRARRLQEVGSGRRQDLLWEREPAQMLEVFAQFRLGNGPEISDIRLFEDVTCIAKVIL